MDNGPEFISAALAEWAEEHNIELEFIKPGKPTQNSRDEILNMYVFRTLNEVRELTEKWVREYNEERPHDSLGDLTPWEYRDKHEQLENSKFRVPLNIGRFTRSTLLLCFFDSISIY